MDRPPIDATGVTLRPAPAVTGEPRSLDDAMTQAAQARGAATRPGEELVPGTMLTRYRIVARLGAGGMGVVYRAHDAQLDREVALKVMRIDEGGTDGRARMLREARAAAKIRHPNVVTVFDADVVEDQVFIAMELIDGVTLKAHFRGRARAWREVVAVLLGAGEGLAAAHAVGLVHRDFKPDNVLVETGGRVRVLDFGLARAVVDVEGPTLRSASAVHESGAAPVLRTLTQTGTVVGTPAYMAPEQHMGRGVDARSDQFSFCVTLFECLFKVRPFPGDTQAELTLNVLAGKLVLPADRGDVPQELIAALQRGLAVEPSARHPSLADLLHELRVIVGKHEPRDRKGLIVALALAVAAGGAGVMVLAGTTTETTETTVVEARTVAAPEVEKKAAVVEAPVARKPAQVVVATVEEPAAHAALLAGLLPDGTSAEVVPEGVALVGGDATAWRDGARALLLEVEGRPARPSGGLLAQVSTPRGLVAVYAIAAADLVARSQVVSKVQGVEQVVISEALQVLVVAGSASGLAAAERAVREAKQPTAREWCVRLHNESGLGGVEKCHPTRAACELDAHEWLGADKTSKSCYAKK